VVASGGISNEVKRMARKRTEAKHWPKFCPHCGGNLKIGTTRRRKGGNIRRVRICSRCKKPVYSTVEAFEGYIV
jgi:hypothetical protein